jgi:hypothetical protein
VLLHFDEKSSDMDGGKLYTQFGPELTTLMDLARINSMRLLSSTDKGTKGRFGLRITDIDGGWLDLWTNSGYTLSKWSS